MSETPSTLQDETEPAQPNFSTAESLEFLATVNGEIAFFRAIMKARPIGIHRHFHILNIRNAIHRDTGHWVSIESVWEKLRALYDMDALEAIVSSLCRQDVSLIS
jgi:hypothetical protein